MIERDFVKQKKREFQVQEFISRNLKNVGHSFTELQRTPLGDKVVIHTSRPGLVVGRKGQNISQLTETLKTEFGLENPQVEISEVQWPNLDATIVAERIASALERFGANRFKGIMHKAMEDSLSAGAIGIEIRLSGKLPSSRAKSWRINGGYLKKSGDAAYTQIRKAITIAKLKSGVIGIQVRIAPPDIILPDIMNVKESQQESETAAVKDATIEAVDEKKEPVSKEETKQEKKETEKKPKRKRTAKSEKEKTEKNAEKTDEQ